MPKQKKWKKYVICHFTCLFILFWGFMQSSSASNLKIEYTDNQQSYLTWEESADPKFEKWILYRNGQQIFESANPADKSYLDADLPDISESITYKLEWYRFESQEVDGIQIEVGVLMSSTSTNVQMVSTPDGRWVRATYGLLTWSRLWSVGEYNVSFLNIEQGGNLSIMDGVKVQEGEIYISDGGTLALNGNITILSSLSVSNSTLHLGNNVKLNFLEEYLDIMECPIISFAEGSSLDIDGASIANVSLRCKNAKNLSAQSAEFDHCDLLLENTPAAINESCAYTFDCTSDSPIEFNQVSMTYKPGHLPSDGYRENQININNASAVKINDCTLQCVLNLYEDAGELTTFTGNYEGIIYGYPGCTLVLRGDQLKIHDAEIDVYNLKTEDTNFENCYVTVRRKLTGVTAESAARLRFSDSRDYKSAALNLIGDGVDYPVDGAVLKDCWFTDSKIFLSYASQIEIRDSTFSFEEEFIPQSYDLSVNAENSSHLILAGNYFTSNAYGWARITGCDSLMIENNTLRFDSMNPPMDIFTPSFPYLLECINLVNSDIQFNHIDGMATGYQTIGWNVNMAKGISLVGNDVRIKNNTITNTVRAVESGDSSQSYLWSGNTWQEGEELVNTLLLQYNKFTENKKASYIDNGLHIKIDQNTIHDNTAGFFLLNVEDLFIANNEFINNGDYGISIENGKNAQIVNNQSIDSNSLLYVKEGDEFTIRDNKAQRNDEISVWLENFQNSTIQDNQFLDNKRLSLSVKGNDVIVFNNIFASANEWTENARGYDIGIDWNVPKKEGKNIVGGPSLGGNYWNDYDGEDEDGDLIGDTPYESIIDGELYVYDPLPLIGPTTLRLAPGSSNPIEKEIAVAPAEEETVSVLHVQLILDKKADSPCTVNSMQFDFKGTGNPSDISMTSLVSDEECSGKAGKILGQSPGKDKMIFSNLGEILQPGESRCYLLQYTIQMDDPSCVTYGAGISPEQVEVAGESIVLDGVTVFGSIRKKGCMIEISSEPSEAGVAALNPAKDCYSPGDTVMLMASANPGYVFNKFSGSSGVGAKNPVTITVDWEPGETRKFIAHFKETPPSNNKNHGRLKDPVNTATGEYYFEIPLFDLGGPLPLSASLYYGSAVSRKHDVDLAFGHITGVNWLHNYQIIRLYKGDTTTKIIYDLGRVITFKHDSVRWNLENNEEIPYELKTGPDGKFYMLDPSKNLVYTFNADRRLERLEDRNGNAHTLTYDTDGFLLSVEDGLGRTLQYTYGDDNRLSSIHDGRGRTWTFTHDEARLTSLTDPMDHVTRFSYDENNKYIGLITQAIYPKGNCHTTQFYDEKGHVYKQLDGDGNVTELNFEANGNSGDTLISYPDGSTEIHTHANQQNLTGTTDSTGAKVNVQYDQNNRRTQVTDRLGAASGVQYHEASGQIAGVTNVRGDSTRLTYLKQEQAFGSVTFSFYPPSSKAFPDGTKELYSYDGKGNLLSKIDQAQFEWQYTYNAHGQMLSQINPAGGVLLNTYTNEGNLISTTNSDIGTTTYQYDPFGRVIQVTNPDGAASKTIYDENDNVINHTDENGHMQILTYDANDNLLRITDPLGNTQIYGYNDMDQRIVETNRLGKSTTFSFDSMGRLAKTQDAGGNVTQYGYDQHSSIASVQKGGKTWSMENDDETIPTNQSTPEGRRTTFKSDAFGLVKAVTDPLGNNMAFTWDAMNRITRITDPLGRSMEMVYDSRSDLIEITKAGIGSVKYQRDALGNVTGMEDMNGRLWAFQYSPMGNLLSQTDPLSQTIHYSYDSCGRLSQVMYPDGQLMKHQFDPAGNMIQKSYSGGLQLDFQYDALNRLTDANEIAFEYDAEGKITNTKQNGLNFDATYNDNSRLQTVAYNNGAVIISYTYNDTTGLLEMVSDNLTNAKVQFVYDSDERLTGLVRSNGVSTDFAWDDANRLTGIMEGDFADLRYTLNTAGEITQVDMQTPLSPEDYLSLATNSLLFDNASQIASPNFVYDAQGRQTKSSSRAYSWDEASRLITIDDVSLQYNGMDNLISRTEDGQTLEYYYNYGIIHTPIVGERDVENETFVRYYVWSPTGELLYMIDSANGNKVFFFHFDRLGSTLALTDQAGQITDAYSYTPYGKRLAHEGNSTQPFTFVGRHGVREEGGNGNLFQMQARYYDAEYSCFLSRDPAWPSPENPLEINPYAYAQHNPVCFSDPSGLFVGDVTTLVAGVLVGGAMMMDDIG